MAPVGKRRPAKRRAGGSAAAAAGRGVAKVDVAAARTFAANRLDGAQVAEKFGNASFSVGGKVFAFTRPEGLVLKLPPDVLARVVAEREAGPLVMGKRVMREWVLLRLDGPEKYCGELELMQVAMKFVNPEFFLSPS
jgi:hypothetical protein